jgi:lysophospholipase L1-like esterase
LLYRIENGELDGVNPKVIVLLIGTNNVGFVPVEGSNATLVEDTTKGIKACLNVLRQKAPKAKILLMGITPRNTNGTTALMPTINQINSRIAKFADGKTIKYLNINDKLADSDGKLHDGLTEDGLHLTNKRLPSVGRCDEAHSHRMAGPSFRPIAPLTHLKLR